MTDLRPVSMGEQEMAAYIRGYLEKKTGHSRQWSKHWCVIKGPMMFFFKDPNTHIPEHFESSIGLCPQTSASEYGKNSKKEFMFEVKTPKGTHRFRCETNLSRTQWLFAIKLSSTLQPPAPLPGEERFDAPGPRKLKHPLQRAKTLPSIPTPTNFEPQIPVRRQSLVGAERESEYDMLKISDSSWYVRGMSREKSEEVLRKEPIGTFLIRDSETGKGPGSFTLSIRKDNRVFHHKIVSQDHGLVFKGQEHLRFNDLDSLVKSYARSNTDLKVRPFAESTSSIKEEDDGYTMLAEDEVFSEKNEPKDLGPRKAADGYEECDPYDTALPKEVVLQRVQDTLDPNINKVPLPRPESPGCTPTAYMDMSRSTAEGGPAFVPRDDEVDTVYLPMHRGSIGSFHEEEGDLEYQNMRSVFAGEPVAKSSYVNLPYANLPPPLPPRDWSKFSARLSPRKPRSSSVDSPVSRDSFPPLLPLKESETPPALPSRPRPSLRKANTIGYISSPQDEQSTL